MKTKESLKTTIESFSKLKKNWGSYNEDEITNESIVTAQKVIDTLPEDLDMEKVNVFPMRDGGVQIEIFEFKEIEIFNYNITEIQFDNNFNIVKKEVYGMKLDQEAKLTTEKKLDLIAKLLTEVAQEFDTKAEQIKDVNLPLYKMLTEGGSYYLKEMYKGLYSSGQLNTFKTRLEAADKLLSDKN